MKFRMYTPKAQKRQSRSPCGERGLKFLPCKEIWTYWRSLPVRGAWVEIRFFGRGVAADGGSLPVRGAWVEIRWKTCAERIMRVAPRAGSVG